MISLVPNVVDLNLVTKQTMRVATTGSDLSGWDQGKSSYTMQQQQQQPDVSVYSRAGNDPVDGDTTFPRFGQLPPELRCKIWRQALAPRNIYFRVKMDMDAWNWASEEDWWAHYMLTGDYNGSSASTPPPPPSLLLVNHEARAEALRAYRPLHVDRNLLRRCIADDSVNEHSLARMCNLTKTPWVNSSTDILEWAHVKRWSCNNPPRCRALFLAASMSVQHISVEYDPNLHQSLVALALAVLDVESCLKSLTIKVAAAGWTSRSAGSGGYNQQQQPQQPEYHEFRLARIPIRARVLRDYAGLGPLLSRGGACLLPSYRQPKDELEQLQSVAALSPSSSPDASPGGPDHDDDDVDDEGNFVPWPFTRGTQLHTDFAIFRVIRSPRDAASPATAAVPLERSMARWDWTEDDHEVPPSSLDATIQGDIALFMHRLSVFAEPRDFDARQRRSADTIPFHGYCGPQFGLP
ncbi:hypothetical protein BX600DRAFT_459435 [Xylariales sp. PMI_506]|nr:hypothetical protein BX600DRAFT_459435 [Xylariales sp. PMI_506]